MLIGVLILLGLVALEITLLARGKKPGMSTFTATGAAVLLLVLLCRAVLL